MQRPSAEARPWLPPGALADGTLSARLGAAVAGWSSRWVARSGIALDGELVREAPPAEGSWLVLDDLAALEVKDEARLALGALMLDAPQPVTPLTAADRTLLETVATTAIEDLCLSLGAAWEHSAAIGWEPATRLPPKLGEEALVAPLCAGATPLMRLLLDLDLATVLRKSRIAGRVGHKPVRPLADGIARAEVRVAALLGRCTLTVADFSGLEAGDVLVLDAVPTEPLAFAVAGGPPAGRCTLEQHGDAIALRILETFEKVPCK